MIFSGSSQSTHTAPGEISKLTYIRNIPRHAKYVWYIVFVVSIIIFVYVRVYLLFLAQLSQWLMGELIGYGPSSSCPSVSIFK